ncbi:hypothetical protein HUU61_00230 [Rhodopseudomonas palustris]|uniref:Uncharacterized protein n=1 Tax=Thiospirillum jenense TaxID=1653858 RepID=A0A839HBJ1_9GAMM|nr:hypothetical protein [Thiospirillum jenense]MBB1089705.1 hypothetical protein [Rhodopseudomonas palustris]MBB1124806.1 hypothetical protein [Thiospirillum jenense]
MKLTAWLQPPVIRQMARQPLFSLLLIVTLGLLARWRRLRRFAIFLSVLISCHHEY